MRILVPFGKNLFRSLYWLLWGFILIAPLAYFSIAHPHHLQNMQNIISHHTALFTCFRWSLILSFFFLWPPMIHRFEKHQGWSIEKIHFWLRQRLKITIWLVLFELVVCDNLLLKAVHLLEGLSQ